MTSGRLRTLATGLILAWFACAGALMPVLRGQADAAQLKSPTPATPSCRRATPESVAAGQKVYQRHCRVCHGADAKGRPGLEDGPAASNLADDTWDHVSTDGELFSVIKNGVPPTW